MVKCEIVAIAALKKKLGKSYSDTLSCGLIYYDAYQKVLKKIVKDEPE